MCWYVWGFEERRPRLARRFVWVLSGHFSPDLYCFVGSLQAFLSGIRLSDCRVRRLIVNLVEQTHTLERTLLHRTAERLAASMLPLEDNL